MMKLNIGDRVILERHKSHWNSIGANPYQGTRYACEGTIYHIDDGHDFVYDVEWDNGDTNNYQEGDLTPVMPPITLDEELFTL